MSRLKKEILSKLKEYAGKMGKDHLGGDDSPSPKRGGLRDFDGYDNVDYNQDMPMDEDSPESAHPQGSKKLTNRTTVMDMLDVISHKEFGPDYHKLSTKQKKEVHKLAIKGKLIKQSPFKESVNEILVIVDKFDKRKQDYDKVYYQDGGKRPGDGDINKAQKEFAKLSKKHKGLTLISVDRNSKMYDVNESVNEGKYNYKADALTAYFKGKIDAKELDRIARDDFKSGIATKKELSNFLSNKFTQDVMSDTYGIPAGTLIKRVRGLMKFAEGKDDGVPQGYNPMVEDKKQIKDLVKKVKFEKIFYDVLDTMEKKYGKRKYRIWLEKSLKDFGINPKHYDYRTNAAAEEKLFQLGK